MASWHLNRTASSSETLSLAPVWLTFALINLVALTLARLTFTIWDSRLLFGEADLPTISFYGLTIDIITLSVLFLPVAVLDVVCPFSKTIRQLKPLIKFYLMVITLLNISGEMITPFFISHFDHRPTAALLGPALNVISQWPLKQHQYKYIILMVLCITVIRYFLSFLFNALWQSAENHGFSLTRAKAMSLGALMCLIAPLWYLPSASSIEHLFDHNLGAETVVVNAVLSLAQSWSLAGHQ